MVSITVISKKDAPAKDKGDLLENLAKDLLKAQGYEVSQELRITGAELDLLCKHKVNKKEIYVECKAQKKNIEAGIVRQLVGTIHAENYSEGWLITTSEFTKDAKGFIEKWEKKPKNESEKLSVYSPQRIIDALQDAKVITTPPKEKAIEFIKEQSLIGDWILLITPFGRYWGVYVLTGGIASGMLIYSVIDNKHISDKATIDNLKALESPSLDYDLYIGVKEDSKTLTNIEFSSFLKVVEVATGDDWNDYRPARPQDFVGRENIQKDIFNFFDNINAQNTQTRIFAITGNSGLGKSSLIAKIRDRSRNKRNKNKYFCYAVDIRGAKSSNYIIAAFLKCLREAQKNGLGNSDIEIKITNPNNSFESESIKLYLESVCAKNQVICLIFDQFEELYSKTELFEVFNVAKDFMLETIATKSNFALGFAWKTDSTTQQDHPAYHLWHQLSDHRKEHKLDIFDSSDISKSITKFEKATSYTLPEEIKYQIRHSCQGFPWLLKKLCKHVYESYSKNGEQQNPIVDLDVSSLFEEEVQKLTKDERVCLNLIAEKAPADWSEIIDISSDKILGRLIDQRLVIRSGDRLNIYWDIFKDYLLTKNLPIVPFNYIPTNDYSALNKVALLLLNDEYKTSENIAKEINMKERTVWNIGADLVMLGIAERIGTTFKLHRKLSKTNSKTVLEYLREKLARHSLKVSLYKEHHKKIITQKIAKEILKRSKPKDEFEDKTWDIYTNRMLNFLIQAGFIKYTTIKEMIVEDSGQPIDQNSGILKQRGKIFFPTASPTSVFEALRNITIGHTEVDLNNKGYKNSISALLGFNIAIKNKNNLSINSDLILDTDFKKTIFEKAKDNSLILDCIKFMECKENISGLGIGGCIARKHNLNWSQASKKRNGNSLKQWAIWVKKGLSDNKIPELLGRSKNT